MTFKELELKRDIQSAIAKAGYKEPSPIQEKAIPCMLEGRDLIACAQTGTGKTAAFALPILNRLEVTEPRKIRALVLTPTRELAIQIFDNFKKYGRYLKLRAVCVYGGARQNPQIAALNRGCDILIATPGRLIDYMERSLVSLSDVEVFVLDEADRMLDMGFIGDVRRIIPCMPKERQTVMFSATMPKEIEQLAREILTKPESIKVAPTSSPAETVEQQLCFTERDNKKLVLAEFLNKKEVRKSIVFTRTKRGADRLVKDLAKEGIASISIHGDKTQGQRQDALQRFKSGKTKVLVATDVAARGIDIPKISHVFNYDLPEEAESYIHRIGRAGRAGASGVAVTLCCAEELNLLLAIEKLMNKQITEVESEYSIELVRKPVREDKRRGRGSRSGAGRSNRRAQGRANNAVSASAGSSRSRNEYGASRSRNRRDRRDNFVRPGSFGGLKIYTIPENNRKALEGRDEEKGSQRRSRNSRNTRRR